MTIEEFQNVDLRVARVLSAERVEGSEKLLRLELDAGDTDGSGAVAKRQIVAGIGKAYAPEELLGKQIVIVANLEPRIFAIRASSGHVSLESRGMLLAATGAEGQPVVLALEREVAPGTKVR